jgi:hypothetical protein
MRKIFTLLIQRGGYQEDFSIEKLFAKEGGGEL